MYQTVTTIYACILLYLEEHSESISILQYRITILTADL